MFLNSSMSKGTNYDCFEKIRKLHFVES